MAIDVSKFIDYGVKQAHASFSGKLLYDLLEDLITLLLQRLLLRIALVSAVLDVESNGVENA